MAISMEAVPPCVLKQSTGVNVLSTTRSTVEHAMSISIIEIDIVNIPLNPGNAPVDGICDHNN